jgi:hypothetical protein
MTQEQNPTTTAPIFESFFVPFTENMQLADKIKMATEIRTNIEKARKKPESKFGSGTITRIDKFFNNPTSDEFAGFYVPLACVKFLLDGTKIYPVTSTVLTNLAKSTNGIKSTAQ